MLVSAMSTLMTRRIIGAIVVTFLAGSLIGFGLSYAALGRAYISADLKDDRLSNIVSHNVKGTIVNFGTATASDIVITAKWYRQGVSFHQETITIPSLEGREVKDINLSYMFGGSADSLNYTVSWS